MMHGGTWYLSERRRCVTRCETRLGEAFHQLGDGGYGRAIEVNRFVLALGWNPDNAGRNFFNRQSLSSRAIVGRWTRTGDENGIRVKKKGKLQMSHGPGRETQMMQGGTLFLFERSRCETRLGEAFHQLGDGGYGREIEDTGSCWPWGRLG
jgi:hypothetical protein